MFFALSKVGFFLIQPSSLMVLAIVGGLLSAVFGRTPRRGLGIAAGGAVALLLAGLLPVGNLVVLPLEQRFAAAPPPGSAADVAGIILLGGFEDGWVSGGRPGLAVNEAAERLTEGLRLARRLGEVPVVFTGGVATLIFEGADATTPVAAYLASMGIEPRRIIVEGRSRNTHENATMTAALVDPRPGRPWVLVTSAAHMPRAMGVFRRAGFDVVAYPVDYRTRDAGDLLRPFGSVPAGLERLDMAVREWIGLVAYRASGRTEALFPAP